MKSIVLLIVVYLTTACNQQTTKSSTEVSDTANNKIDTQHHSLATNDTNPPTNNAGKTTTKGSLSINKGNKEVLDSLFSEDPQTRGASFMILKLLWKTSDDESLSSFTKSYFELHSAEALQQYKQMTAEEKQFFIKNISKEFYNSGAEYKNDIIDFFIQVNKTCKSCAQQDAKIIETIKATIITEVAKVNE